jgi:hypothetical protein
MDTQAMKKWAKTALIAAVGGGMTAALAAAFDPAKYDIRHDLGSGKLWDFFFEGSAVALGAMLIKSPWGRQAMSAYTESQSQAKQDKAELDAARKQFGDASKKP